jgi:hypothetical protein
MARAPTRFTERDVKAAVRAVRAAGERVERVEISKDGRIVIILSHESAEPIAAEGNEWDGES